MNFVNFMGIWHTSDWFYCIYSNDVSTQCYCVVAASAAAAVTGTVLYFVQHYRTLYTATRTHTNTGRHTSVFDSVFYQHMNRDVRNRVASDTTCHVFVYTLSWFLFSICLKFWSEFIFRSLFAQWTRSSRVFFPFRPCYVLCLFCNVYLIYSICFVVFV